MNSSSLAQMPGYRMAEYQLILHPHQDLRNKILNLKKEFSDNYNLPFNGSKPHVTLVRFKIWELIEEKLINHLKIIAMGLPPVRIALKDYGFLPSHTIYINIESKVAVQNIIKQLKETRRLMKGPESDPYFPNDLFIPLAQKIPSEIYDKASIEYAHRHFTGNFISDNLLLLKRREGDYGYKIAGDFKFMNLPVSVKQGDLF